MNLLRNLLLGIALFVATHDLSAQTLNNTDWIVYDHITGSIYRYIQFRNDTVKISADNINYQSISNYSESGNVFTIVDLSGSGSPCASDTGIYTFTLSNDTLDFKILNDPCASRVLTIDTRIWVSLSTSLFSINDNERITLYPIPSTGILNISTDQEVINKEFLILDHKGKLVLSGYLNEIRSINIESLDSGIYLIYFNGTSGSGKKFIKL